MRRLPSFLRIQLAWLAALAAGLYALAGIGHLLQDDEQVSGKLRVVLFINGTLGDKSFFDSAARGMHQAAARLPITARVVEGGVDPTRWQSALADLADSGNYDLIITGTFTMVHYVEQLAMRFPGVRFVVYDAAVDQTRCRCANVQSIVFRQNEAAYLAGFLAAKLDGLGLMGAQAGGGLGVIGGMKLPVVEDFIVGFRAGAAAALPQLAVNVQYADSFSDPAVGKEIAKAHFARGAGVVFHVAGATGQGVNEAALEARRYAIGVDADQAALLRDANPELAARVITSVLKHVDVAVVHAIERNLQPGLRGPATRSLGLADNGVDLVWQSEVLNRMPAALRKELDLVRDEIVQGSRIVPSAFTPQPASEAKL